MLNLFVITTPFQLLNCYEAINKLNLQNNHLVIIENGNFKSKIQLSTTIQHSPIKFTKIIKIEKNDKTKFFKTIQTIKKFKRQNLNSLFIGDLGTIHKIFISNMNTQNIYLLDDGNVTIRYYNELINKKNIYIKNIRQIRYKLFGLKISSDKPINFFSIFNLKSNNSIKIIINKFDYLRKQYNLDNKKNSNEIYILGESLVESGLTDEKTYNTYIKNIIKRYPLSIFYYIPHRNEELSKLKSFEPYINIINTDLPGELFFAKLAEKPKLIIGSCSTLLFSLKVLFNNINIHSYRIVFNNEFNEIYSQLQTNNISVIELEK